MKDEIYRGEDGRLLAQGGAGDAGLSDAVRGRESGVLPARLAGGSGASAGQRKRQGSGGVDLDKIRPGMSAEDMERVRQEIARVASQTLRGL